MATNMTNKTTPKDMERIALCTPDFVRYPNTLPVSYEIAGKSYCGIPDCFYTGTEKRFVDANLIERVHTGKDPETGLVFTAVCQEYLDFPVVDWTFYIENAGTKNSPVISEFHGMDGFLPGTEPKIICNNGDTCDDEYYTDTCIDLTTEKYFSEFPEGGRSNECAVPYYRVLCRDFSYTLSIGWAGQWLAKFTLTEEGFRFQAKQQYTHFYLKPGEKVRTPRMTIMAHEGGLERAINIWRRWLFAHVVPKVRGNTIAPMVSISNANDARPGEECGKITEQQMLRALEHFEVCDIDTDMLWIDAGWYPCNTEIGWRSVGNWYADKERFPNGLKPIGDWCHAHGMKFLLWFEVERVALKYSNIPEKYIIPLKDHSILDSVRMVGWIKTLTDDMGLLNLGDSECCEWITNHVDSLVKEYGIDIYRQDCNFPPLHWWLQNDEPDRLGITENLHIQGLFRFWDELLLRNPGLWINSVASGGRRTDLETLQRSVPLHQSDYGLGKHPVYQAMQAFSLIWQPYCGGSTLTQETADGEYNGGGSVPAELNQFDNFAAHNAFAPFYQLHPMGERCVHYLPEEYRQTKEYQYYKEYSKIWKRAVPYTLEGDLYILQMTDRTNKCWHSIQFHHEDKEEGIIQAIRNNKAPDESLTVYPRGIDASKTYYFESPEFGRSVTVSGEELKKNGFTIILPKRTGEIWFYRTV